MGLTFATTPAHIARATIESMALQTRDVVETMSAAAGGQIAELRIDGGAAVNNLLCSIQADQLGAPVSRPIVTETTALGAAMLAGLAEGVWSSPAEAASVWKMERRFEPSGDQAEADRLHTLWRQTLERTRRWPVRELDQ